MHKEIHTHNFQLHISVHKLILLQTTAVRFLNLLCKNKYHNSQLGAWLSTVLLLSNSSIGGCFVHVKEVAVEFGVYEYRYAVPVCCSA